MTRTAGGTQRLVQFGLVGYSRLTAQQATIGIYNHWHHIDILVPRMPVTAGYASVSWSDQ